MGSSSAGHGWVMFPEKTQHLSMQLKNARILFCGQEEEGSKENHLLIKIHQTKIRKFPWMIFSAKPTPSSTCKKCHCLQKGVNCFKLPTVWEATKAGVPYQHPPRPPKPRVLRTQSVPSGRQTHGQGKCKVPAELTLLLTESELGVKHWVSIIGSSWFTWWGTKHVTTYG